MDLERTILFLFRSFVFSSRCCCHSNCCCFVGNLRLAFLLHFSALSFIRFNWIFSHHIFFFFNFIILVYFCFGPMAFAIVFCPSAQCSQWLGPLLVHIASYAYDLIRKYLFYYCYVITIVSVVIFDYIHIYISLFLLAVESGDGGKCMSVQTNFHVHRNNIGNKWSIWMQDCSLLHVQTTQKRQHNYNKNNAAINWNRRNTKQKRKSSFGNNRAIVLSIKYTLRTIE